jgi:hypothetical protein
MTRAGRKKKGSYASLAGREVMAKVASENVTTSSEGCKRRFDIDLCIHGPLAARDCPEIGRVRDGISSWEIKGRWHMWASWVA